jgi:hypothetical protein
MATREEVLTNLTKAAKQGNIRDAYRDFEELPFVDQVAISISPGIGDALAVYEIGEFGARGAKNIAEKDFLGALGNYGLSGLSAISILPLFRLFRGAKAIKAIDPVIDAPRPRKGKTGLKGPGEYQAEQAAKKAKETIPVPKVEEFKPLSLDEMIYPGTKVSKSTNEITGLTSKVAKFVNNNDNFSGKNSFLKTEGKLATYINTLKKSPGITEGELRLLKLIDETGEIHPQILKVVENRNPNNRIARQKLAQYIKNNQREVLQRRLVKSGDEVAPNRLTQLNRDVPMSNEKEFTYHVAGIKRGKELGRHYGGKTDHEAHYAFDAAADLNLAEVRAADGSVFPIRSNADIMGPTTPIIKSNDKVLNVGRIQSDYSRELGKLAEKNKSKQIEAIFDDAEIDVLGDSMNNNLRNFAIKIARENPQLKTANELKLKVDQKLKKGVIDGGADLPPGLQGGQTFNLDQIEANVVNTLGYNPFEAIQRVVKESQTNYSISPYIDNKAVAALKKELAEYNKDVPRINKLSQDEVKLQNEIKSSGLSLDSPSLTNDLAKLEEIRAERQVLVGRSVIKNMDNFQDFTLSPKELTDATGKSFADSLNKTSDEIFYELEAIAPGSPAMRQKYGPGTPDERALNYFNKMVNNNEMTFDIGNGIKLLKEASNINFSKFPGVPVDAYAKGTKTEMFKFPVRSRFLEAVTKGYDGFSLDSAAKRLRDEGGSGTDFLETFYEQDIPNEINKMLKELGVNPKEYVGKISAEDNLAYSGTYVKIDEALRKLVKEKGIDAFQAGGPVSIQDQLNQLNETILPIDISSDVGSIKPNDFNSLLEETGISPVGSEGAESIILAMSIRAMNPLQKAQAIRASTAPVLKKLKSLHEQKQKYVENNSATQFNKYVERLNRYNRDIQLAENKIKDISKMYDPKNYNAGGAVDDDLPDVGSIIPIGPYTKPLKPDLTYGDPVINKLKKAFNFLGDVKEFVLPTPKVTDPLSLIDYVTSSSAPVIAGKTVVKGLSKINLDGEDIDELVEWVGSSKTQGAKDRMQNLLNGNFYNKRNVSKEKNPIKNTTQKYLKENNLVDKNGNVHLYRYLNIHESKTLQPDQGLSSLTLNPNHAKEMAYKQANVKGSQLKAGEKADIFDSMDPFAGSKYETTTMYRKPVVLEYMVPAEKIDAYLPAVFNSLDDASISKYSAFNADNRFSNLIDELVEDGDEYYDAVDSIGKQYGVDNFYDALDTVKKESEALVDLTNIKPKNIYTESLEIDQIANNPLIEKLEFNTGGPVSIESMLAAL